MAPYVRAIGPEAAAKVFFAFGGAGLYLAADPKSRSPLVPLIGRDNALKLAEAIGPGLVQVPTGKPFLARHLADEGWKIAEIARKLHVDDETVRRYLSRRASRHDSPQLPLL